MSGTPPRLSWLFGALLGALTGALALGEVYAFAAPGGSALRVSVYLVLGAVLAIDETSQARLVLSVAAVALLTGLVGSLLDEAPLVAALAGAACLGWAASQLTLALRSFGAGGIWGWPVALAPALCAAVLTLALGSGGAWDAWLTTPWIAGGGVGLGAVCLVQGRRT